MHYRFLKYLMCSVLVITLSCSQEKQRQKSPGTKKEVKKSLLEANKKVVKTEEQHIRDFLNRYSWEMEETGSGLRYMIYEKGAGKAIERGDIVELNYEVLLITGDKVYSSDESGPMEFVVGKAEVISGLEEGILLLHVGDKAKFIIPSHLAYGLLGDEDKIPNKSTLIYDVEVILKRI